MRETLLAFISSRPFFFITLSDAARTLCFWKHCRALPISVPHPTPSIPPHGFPARVGPDCWKPAQPSWPHSKPGHFGNCHTQVPGPVSVAQWGRLCGLGVGKHTWPKINITARCANSRPAKIPGKARLCKNNMTGLDGRLTWSHPTHMKLGSVHTSIVLTRVHPATKNYLQILSQFTLCFHA